MMAPIALPRPPRLAETRWSCRATSWRSALVTLLGLVFASAGCADAEIYSYVNVAVSIDKDTISETQRYLVTSCEFQVTGAETSVAFDLGCRENNVQYDVGQFQWTSKAGKGALQFLVQVFDGNHMLIGEGTSAPVSISPGKVYDTSVLVKGVVPPAESDGGMDSANPADATAADVVADRVDASGDGLLDGATADVGGDATGGDAAPALDAATDAGTATDAAPDTAAQDGGSADAIEAG